MNPLTRPALFLAALAAIALSSCERDEGRAPSLAAAPAPRTAEPTAEPTPPAPPPPAVVAPTRPTSLPEANTDLILTADARTKGGSGATARKDAAPDKTASSGTKTGSAAAKSGATLSEAAMKEAKSMYGMRCASCHGMDGSGQGPIAAALKPPPRDFRDPTWQTSVTDQNIEKIIEGGGTAVGKSPAMPANPDLAGKPVVQGLRAYIRSMKP